MNLPTFRLNNSHRYTWGLVFISFALFVASLCCTALVFDTQPSVRGFDILTNGWLEIFRAPWPGILWLANPLLLLSWVSLVTSTKSTSIRLSVSAAILTLGGLVMQSITGFRGPIGIHSLGLGYYLWVMCAVVALGGSLGSHELSQPTTIEEKSPSKRYARLSPLRIFVILVAMTLLGLFGIAAVMIGRVAWAILKAIGS